MPENSTPSETMPPSADTTMLSDDSFGLRVQEIPLNNINDVIIAGIEVEALESQDEKCSSVTTRISLVATSPTSVINGDSEVQSTAAKDDFRQMYKQTRIGNNRMECDSFDSIDEIPEGSYEAKLLRRVAKGAMLELQVDDTLNAYTGGSFDEAEAQYMGVLDKHTDDANRNVHRFSQLEESPDHAHHKKSSTLTIEDFMDHLITIPCCECTTEINSHKPLTSALRPQKLGLKHMPELHESPKPPYTRLVAFKDVNIVEFPMTLGLHPSATTGPPIMMDWESGPCRQHKSTMDEYEKTRVERRGRRQLKLSLKERHNILVKQKGFTFDEVKVAWQEALEIRKQRRETLERGLALMKFDEVWESTCRKFNRVVDFTFG